MQIIRTLYCNRIDVARRTCEKLLIGILGICVVGLGQAAQEPEDWSDEKSLVLDRYLDALAEQGKFNGAVLMAADGEVVYEKYLGFADINDKTKVLGPRSSFRLGSLSKQFTAMGIMILKERGKLDFDDDIQEHLPSLPYEGITIRHLLHHNAGLPDYEAWFISHWDIHSEFDDRKAAFNNDVVEQFSKARPKVLFKPGEYHEYSNTGYVMLGQIIENASGMPIRQFFQDSVFTPLHMNDTQAFSPDKNFTVAERVYGYDLLADGRTARDNDWNFMNGMIGDGGIYASARDLLKWDQAWYGEKLVSQKTIAEAYNSGRTNDGEETGHGFGWALIKNEAGKVRSVTHDGSWVGFRTSIQRNLEDNRTGIVLTNNSGNGFEDVIRGLGQLHRGEELTIPPENVSYELAAIIEIDGIDAAVERFHEIERTTSEDYLISDELIESLAVFYRERQQSDIGDKLDELGRLRPDVALTSEQLEKLVGTYTLAEDFKIRISTRGSRLFGQATDQEELLLRPITDSRFSVVGVEAEISFTKDEQGKSVSLTLHQNGANQEAVRAGE